ncbi:MAG: dihydroorotate dehydrogenase electron transfer subunit [Spirochaetales bacterium]|jgi:dihydroorotate dehydrogenase electron transfer subunit|nr:dihydroorotate dehydrogenase electron transfer subunit [Spirochaetales bacterium]
MKQFQAKVKANRPVSDGYYLIEFSWPRSLQKPLPGQFLTVKNTNGSDPLLRRPFAVAGFDEEAVTATVVYQIRGGSTQSLASKRPGSALNILGPLGNTFPESPPESTSILVSGGIGFGPIYYLSKALLEQKVPHISVIGARSADLIPDAEYPDLNGKGIYCFCTDDGSKGFTGTVVDYLNTIGKTVIDGATLYACGPTPMLEGCVDFAARRSLKCYVSLEQIMGCGVGACMGCAVRAKGSKKYSRVCTEGPVFDAELISWK